MKTRDFLSILIKRPWIIAIIVFVLISVVLLAGIRIIKATEEKAIIEFNQRQLVMAKEAANGIELFFTILGESAKAIARNIQNAHFDKRVVRTIIAHEMNELVWLGVNDIGILDADGIMRYNVKAPEIEGIDFSSRRYFKRAREMTSDDTYILQFIEFKGVEAGQKGLLVAVPMFESAAKESSPSNSGNFKGVVVCTLRLNIMNEKFIAPIKPSENGSALMIDGRYNVLWSPDRNLLGKNILKETDEFPLFQQILKKMIAGDSGAAEYTHYSFDSSTEEYTKNHEHKLIAYVSATLGTEKWAVGVWAPREDAMKLIRSAFHKQLLLICIVIATILLCFFYAIAMSMRYGRTLEEEVTLKTREFKDAYQRLFTVLESLNAAVYVVADTYEIVYLNKYAIDSFGDVAGEFCWKTLRSGQSGPCPFCVNSSWLTTEKRTDDQHIWEFVDQGEERWFESHYRPIQWVDGRLARLEIATDITERKLAGDELAQSHQEIESFCRILKEIGIQNSLSGVGSFLIQELQSLLHTSHIQLYVYSHDYSHLFALSEKGSDTIKDTESIQMLTEALENLDRISVFPKIILGSPLLATSFPPKWQQAIIPLRVQGINDGALVINYAPDYQYDEKMLDRVALILAQTSGTIKRAVVHEEEIRSLRERRERTPEFYGIVSKNNRMQEVFKLIEVVAPTDATVLIQGESGTGKELVALAIHKLSLRNEKPFVVINCAAYPDTLIESELFGHEKGAFTGAIRQRNGRFEQADSGTVFLDEIGEIPHSVQIKLLRVLQTKKLKRVGGEQIHSVDVRILAATNKDLLEEVKAGNFREDLYYRLKVIPIHLPPLRERRNDIPLLVGHFQKQFASEQDQTVQNVSSDVLRTLLDYHWPGNVRELENTIEHVMVLSEGRRIESSHLPAGFSSEHVLNLPDSNGVLQDNEKKVLLEVLKGCNGNKSQAAQRLGISRSSLYFKIKKHNVLSFQRH